MAKNAHDEDAQREAVARPALRAVAALLLAGLVVIAVAALLRHFTGSPMDPRLALALHGLVSLILVWWWGLPWWWRFIVLVFAPAVALGMQAELSAWIWGLGFLLIAGISWGAVSTRVPLFLSNRNVWSAVESLLSPDPIRVIDLGSGLGGLAMHLAKHRPDMTVEGIELAPLTWFAGWLRGLVNHSRARLRFGDYRRLSFADYDLAFAFLSPAAMPDLWAKANAEMRAGTLLVSCEFEIPGVPPWQRIEIPEGRPLLVWKMAGPGSKP